MDQAAVIQQSIAHALREYQQGRLAEAESLCDRILELDPDHADSLHLLGLIALDAKATDDAIDLIGRAIAKKGDISLFHASLGLVLHECARFADAIASYERALQLDPEFADVYYNLGLAHSRNGDAVKAAQAFQKAVLLRSDFAQAFNNLGHALRKQNQLDDAVIAYSRALAIQPDHVEARSNLGVTMKDLGRLDESIECLRQALEFAPDSPAVHSNLVYALHYHDDYGASALCREHAEWNARHAARATQFTTWDNDPSPDRRLRIGYVSPDFREHCQSLFTLPLFSNHDHEQVEVFCYSSVPSPDDTTGELMTHADVWRNAAFLRDGQLAELIRQDRIDILIDLTLHMANNRLLMFAMKPAPVQVTWLGYPGTTGLTSIDYRLTDPCLDPRGVGDENYAEASIRLPDTFWCYDPRSTEPVRADPPAKTNGFVTFGCLNNFCKITDQTLEMWSRVLRAVPGSRLKVLAPPGGSRAPLVDRLGVDPARVFFIDFQPRDQYLKLYNEIDICLDTFPYNGHTTSLDSWWMGVPVVSLCGQTAVSRAGLSQASNLGMTELVASAPEEFVRIAVELARDPSRFAHRASLRERMTCSPLMDAPRFARSIESAYRTIWRSWCERQPNSSSSGATMSHTTEGRKHHAPVSIQR